MTNTARKITSIKMIASGMRISILFLFLICSFGAQAQKKSISHLDYPFWKTLSKQQLSSDGQWVHYEINPYKGDGFLYLFQTATHQLDSFPKGKQAALFANEQYFSFLISPGYDTLRQLELEKVKKDKWVKDSLVVLSLPAREKTIFPNVHQFKTSQTASVIAFLQTAKKEEKNEDGASKKKKKRKVPEEEKTVSKGHNLILHAPATQTNRTFEYITQFELSKNGNYIAAVQHKEIAKKDSFSLVLINVNTSEIGTSEYFTAIGPISFDHKEQYAFLLASKDTVKENKNFSLYKWDLTLSSPSISLQFSSKQFDSTTVLGASNFLSPYFSQDNQKFYFGWKPIAQPAEKDTLLAREKAVVDLWHYQDARLQPQQLVSLKKDQQKSYLSVLDLASNQLTLLENDTVTAQTLAKGNCDKVIASVRSPYEANYQWEYPWAADYYLHNTENNERHLLKKKVGYYLGTSPTGDYFFYYDTDSEQVKYLHTLTKEEKCLTCFGDNSEIKWTEDNNGMPHPERPFALAGFTKNNSVVYYSEFDCWETNLTTNETRSISNEQGKATNTIFRLVNTQKDSVHLDLAQMYLHAIDDFTKDETIYQISISDSVIQLKKQIESNHKYQEIAQSKNGAVIFRRMNVEDYPDLYFSNAHFDSIHKISHSNPQQSEYNWPTVETVNWDSYEGKSLTGLLYKPADFDSSKTYPLLVYFYELYSDRKHQHYIPKPTASIIFATEYASAGYLVFMPDIRYDAGYPARSAYDCIMSGTDHVLALYPNIDSTKMGLQGQSWGGYQTAQLITMTNRYRAAMAGAPVGNMFSAYGGIRWSSGYNRQFQYERTQSRIGKTIWEAPELYVENSPLFALPNVQTPLLMMHNDNDGAVPWYQGIELFTGLKRLGKPVWMLNYNGDEHNLMKPANREDLSIRMRQFFDHYLLEKPAPRWLVEGIPALEKGKDNKLELGE